MSETDPCIHEHPATGDRLAVRVDGEWMPYAAEYGSVLVFWRDDDWNHLNNGTQIDVTEHGVCYVPENTTPITLEEYVDEGGVASYIAPNDLPISNVEVHDVIESEAHDSFPNGGDFDGDERGETRV
jgi:hypothetical protein